ncbi:MAG: hypothetical protein JSS10_00255 [Verrucomicrobia bacterium]|nr:hypothetical protein [Verrucomicrobiota bacterium]
MLCNRLKSVQGLSSTPEHTHHNRRSQTPPTPPSAPPPAVPKGSPRAEASSFSLQVILAPGSVIPKDPPHTDALSPPPLAPPPAVLKDPTLAASPPPSETLSLNPVKAVEPLKTTIDSRGEADDEKSVRGAPPATPTELEEIIHRCPKWNEKRQNPLETTRFIAGLHRSVAEICSWVEKSVASLREDNPLTDSLESWEQRLVELRELNKNLLQKNVDEKKWAASFQELLAHLQILEQTKLETWKKREDKLKSTPLPALNTSLPPAASEEPQSVEAAFPPNPVPRSAEPSEQPQSAPSPLGTEISDKDVWMKDLFKEFQMKLEGLLAKCPRWNENTQSDTTKAHFRRQFRPFMREAMQTVEKFVNELRQDKRLKGYSLGAWEQMLKDIQKLNDDLGTRATENTLYIAFMTLVPKLRELEQTRQEALKAALDQELKQIPAHQFTDLAEYLPHLKLNIVDAVGVGKQENWLFAYGISTMKDIDILKLRDFEPSIHILRQLCCCLEFAVGEEKINPELSLRFKAEVVNFINKVKEPCSTGYAEEENISRDILKILQEMLSAPYTKNSIGKLFSDLDIIAIKDAERQVFLLNAYINQYGCRSFWAKSFQNEIYTLSQFYSHKNVREPYRIGFNA